MENHFPLVTVAIPFYNAQSHLKEAILSVCNQTYTNIEILLLDDGSTDNSLFIASSFHDNRIRIVTDGTNKGLVYRLNQSVKLANGVFYARMDSDDIMHCERIEKQVNALLHNTNIDVLGTSIYTIDNENRICSCVIMHDNTASKEVSFVHPSVMARREWMLKNPYDRKYLRVEDRELWLRTSHFSTFHNLPEPLMFYRQFGIPTCKKYLLSQLGCIKIALHPHTYHLSITQMIKEIIVSIFKSAVCISCYFVGNMDLLVQMRKVNNVLFNNELASSALNEALKERVDR